MLCLLRNSFFVFCFTALSVIAQETEFVSIEPLKEIAVKPGEKKTMQLYFKVREGYHIQADSRHVKELIPTVLSFTDVEGIRIENIKYPDPKMFYMEGVQDPLPVFGGEVLIPVSIEASKAVSKNTYTIKGELAYQACDAKKCFFPRKLPFEVPVRIQ